MFLFMACSIMIIIIIRYSVRADAWRHGLQNLQRSLASSLNRPEIYRPGHPKLTKVHMSIIQEQKVLALLTFSITTPLTATHAIPCLNLT